MPRIYNNIGPKSENLEIGDFQTDAELPDAPQELTVYRIIRPEEDADYATCLAGSLGFDGEPEEWHSSKFPLNGFSFRNGEHVLSVYEDGSIDIIYVLEPARPASLPSDEECIAIARKWLEDHGLYPDNVINISVSPNILHFIHERVEGEYTQNMVVTFTMGLDGYELLGMGAYVAIGEDGEVLRVFVNAPEFKKYTTVGVRRPQAALDTFRAYLNYPELFYSDNPKCLIDRVGPKMRVTGISIKYFCMLTEENAAPAFAQPIYVLDGYYSFYEAGRSTGSFNGRVDAVIR